MALPKSKWLEDAHAGACVQCGNVFSVLFRRHHCRACGLIFCDNCAPKREKEPYAGIRVCAACMTASSRSGEAKAAPPSGPKVAISASRRGSSHFGLAPEPSARPSADTLQARKSASRVASLTRSLHDATVAKELLEQQLELFSQRHAAEKRSWATVASELASHRGSRAGSQADEVSVANRTFEGTLTSARSGGLWDEESAATPSRSPSSRGGHTCVQDVTVIWREGPLGLTLTSSTQPGCEYALVIERVDSDDLTTPAGTINAQAAPDACCGYLIPGMCLVSVSGQSTRRMSETAARHALNTARKPAMLKFRAVTIQILRAKFDELQSRYSSLCMRLELNEEVLKREAVSSTARLKIMSKKLRLLVHSYKDLQGQHDDLLRTVSSLRSENEQLYAQRRDLEMRLAFVGSAVPASSGAANAFSGVTASGARRVSGLGLERTAEERFRQELAAARAETEAIRRLLVDKSAELVGAEGEIRRVREALSAAESKQKDVEAEKNRLVQLMFPGKDASSNRQSDIAHTRTEVVDPHQAHSGRPRSIDPQAIWVMYNQERRDKVALEDQLARALARSASLESQMREVFEKFSRLQVRMQSFKDPAAVAVTMKPKPIAAVMSTPEGEADAPDPYGGLIERHVVPVPPKPKGAKLRALGKSVAIGARLAAAASSAHTAATVGEEKEEGDAGHSSGSEDDAPADSDASSDGAGPAVAIGRRAVSESVRAEAKRCLDIHEGEPILAQVFRKSSRDDGSRFRMPWKNRYVTVGCNTFFWYERESDTLPKGSRPLSVIEKVTALDSAEIGKECAFLVKIPGQSIFLRAPDEATRRHWVDVMQLAVEMSKAAASEVKAPPGPVDSDDSEYDS